MNSQHSAANINGKIRITYLPSSDPSPSNNVLIRIPSSSSSSDLRQVIGVKRRVSVDAPQTSYLNGAPVHKKSTNASLDHKSPTVDPNLANRLQTVITKLAASEERVCGLEAELLAAQKERNAAVQEASELRVQQSAQAKKSAELVQILGTLESAINDLQKRNKELENENERLKTVADGAETSVASFKEQNDFLSARNATLAKKCESLCAENKKLASDHLLASSELSDLKPKHETLLKDFKTTTEQKDKFSADARTADETGKRLQREKQDLERRLQLRESLRAEAVRSFEERIAKLLAEKHELERRLLSVDTRLPYPSSSSSSSDNELLRAEIATMKSTIDAMKRHFESKLQSLSTTCQNASSKMAEMSKQLNS